MRPTGFTRCIAMLVGLVALAVAFCVAPASANSAAVLKEGPGSSIVLPLELVINASATASADELFARWDSLEVRARPNGLSEGFQSRAIWVRFTVERSAQLGSHWWLIASNPLLDRIDIHIEGPDGKRSHRVTGEDLPVSQAPVGSVLPAAELEFAEGRSRVLLRIETRNALATRLSLGTEHELFEKEHLQSFAGGLLAGGHLAVAVAALVVGFTLRERIWFTFSLFVALNALILLHSMGLPSWAFLREYPGLADRVNGALLMLGLAAALDFSFRLGRADILFPRTFRIASRCVWVFSIVAAVLMSLGYFVPYLIRAQVAMLLAIPVMVVGLFVQWRRKVDFAGYYFAGVGGYSLATEVRFMRNIGVFPSAWWTEGLQEFSSIGYLSVLAVGISLQSRKALAERNRLANELATERSARESEREFLAMLSHELRTPIATIEASTQVLREVDSLDASERMSRYRKIERSVGRIRALFDRQLASERVQGDWKDVNRQPTDLVPLLARVRENQIDDERLLRVVFRPESERALAMVDADLIAIAVGNLLANALAYGPASGEIVLLLQRRGEQWRVSVIDRGEPLSEIERQSLFSRFVRGSRSAGTSGAGLGLFVVRRIARAHGGEAGVDSRPGSGNCFWVDIPAQGDSPS